MKLKIAIIVLLVIALLVGVSIAALDAGQGTTVTGEKWLAIQFHSRVEAAPEVVNGNGTDMDYQGESPAVRRGGVPIASISYADGIHIDFSDPVYEDLHFGRVQIDNWTKKQTIAEAEAKITEEAQKYLEVWLDMRDFDPEDPAMQDPPELADNERIERRQGRDWLVTTTGYFAIHVYSLDFYEGDFITRINGLDAGPIEGDWWL